MAYIAAVFMGLVLGALGGGGGVLTVPIFVYLFAQPPEVATGSSLFVVGVASLFGAIPTINRKEADLAAAITIAIPSSIGTFLARSLLVPAIPEQMLGIERGRWLMGAFAVIMLVVGSRMLSPAKENPQTPTRNLVLTATIGLTIGIVSGTLGAGGGFLIVPALTLLLGVDLKRAISTSLLVIAAQSLVGFSGELRNSINWELLLSVTGAAIAGMFLGIALRDRAPKQTLQRAFAYMVLAMAIWVISQVL